jgi:hypothetical protein
MLHLSFVEAFFARLCRTVRSGGATFLFSRVYCFRGLHESRPPVILSVVEVKGGRIVQVYKKVTKRKSTRDSECGTK